MKTLNVIHKTSTDTVDIVQTDRGIKVRHAKHTSTRQQFPIQYDHNGKIGYDWSVSNLVHKAVKEAFRIKHLIYNEPIEQ